MSGKVKNKGSSNYDVHNNIMALEGDIDDQMKYKINKVLEVIKNRTEEDVMLVLQYFDYDIDTTIDAFLQDGASDILKMWNHTNSIKPNNKNKKKKKNKKKSSVQETMTAPSVATSETVIDGETAGVTCNAEVVFRVELVLPNGDEVSPPEGNNSSQVGGSNKDSNASTVVDACSRVSPSHAASDDSVNRKDSSPPPPQPPAMVSRLSVQGPSQPAKSAQSSEANLQGPSTLRSVPERSSISPSEYNRTTSRNRHRSSGSQSRSPQDGSRTEVPPFQAPSNSGSAQAAFPQAPGKKILEKSLKDLSRQTVALQRFSNLLEEELDTSFKRIKTAISEAQRLLEVRNQELEQEMEKVKKESRQLLNQRKDLAAELKLRAERASTMGDSELNELRADIKHFVIERKYDEELGKTCRFMWDKDRITDEIKCFGEVCHVKNSYSQRRQSVSSVASSSNMTSSITEPPELTPASQTELDQEISEPSNEHAVPDTRPAGNIYPNRPRFFFRRIPNSDSNRPGYNRGTHSSRGRGGSENRGGRGRGGGRGGRRDDGYRGGHDTSYYNKPHYTQKSEDHGSSVSGTSLADTGVGSGSTSSGTTSWPPKEQRASRRGGGRQNNPNFQGRMHAHNTPRCNSCNDDRVPAGSDTHVNGKSEASDLMNGFVDH